MGTPIKKLQRVWDSDPNRGIIGSENKHITFETLANNIVSTCPCYFYVVDFENALTMSHVNPTINEILGFDPKR
ncbi:hypothetical protein [Flavobacterium sp. 3HN19-14]|uniref:hypothetical protein n=1 Tax=Flavobacterium sp. 3HN19-14 TaxID=3448133 RepID=UPI003EE2D78C